MKRFFIITTVGLLLLASCGNLQMPETVTIKTDPVLRIPLGGRADILAQQDMDIETQLNDAITESGTDGLSVISSENPEDPVMLEFRYDVQDVSINNMADENFSLGEVTQTIEPMSFDVPAIEEPSINSISVDLSSIPSSSITIPGYTFDTLKEPGISTPPQNISLPAPLSTGGADGVSFDTGSVDLVITLDTTSPNASITLNSATLTTNSTDIDGTVSSGGSDYLSSNPLTMSGDSSDTIYFSLNGIEMGSDLDFSFNVELSGGVPDQDLSLTIAPVINDSSVIIKEVTDSIDIAIDIASDSELVEATLLSGSNVQLDFTKPDDWTNIEIAKNLELFTVDASNTETSFTTASSTLALTTLDLTGLTIAPGDGLKLDYTVIVSGPLADFTSSSGGKLTISPTVNFSDTVTAVINADSLDLSTTIYQDLDQNLLDLVSSVTFDNPYIYLGIQNGLPIDLTFNVISNAMDVDTSADPLVFTANSSLTQHERVALLSSTSGALDLSTLVDNNSDANNTPDIDFAIDVTAAGYTAATGTDPATITMDVSTSGETYSFGGQVVLYSHDDAETDISVNITNPLAITDVGIAGWSMSGTMPEDYATNGGMDLGSNFSALDEMVPGLDPSFYGIEAFLDVDLSALAGETDNNSIELYMEVTYDDADGTTWGPYPLIYDTISHPDYSDTTIPTISASRDPRITSGIDRITLPEGVFDDLINRRATNLVMSYDATIGTPGSPFEITVDPDSTQEMNISVSVLAEIPVQIGLESTAPTTITDNDGNPVDVIELEQDDGAGGTKPMVDPLTDDLFGRGEAEENSEFFEFLTSARIVLNLTNELLYLVDKGTDVNDPSDDTITTDLAVYFVIDEPASGFSKQIQLDLGTGDIVLDLTNADVMEMVDPANYPFTPEFHIYVPEGLYRLGTGDISLDSSYIEVRSNVDYEVPGGDQ